MLAYKGILWTLKHEDSKWLEDNKVEIHSGYKTKKEAEKAMRQIWTECNPYIDEFTVIFSGKGKHWDELRYCILVSNPDIIM